MSAALAASLVFAAASPAAQGVPGEKPEKPVKVTSDTMEASSPENLVVFRGNVVVEEDFTLCSDELFITYGADKEIRDIKAKGNVRIFQDNKVATCTEAVYDRNERKLVLTGDPQVTQCTDTVKGDRITVFLDDDRAMVESDSGGRVQAVIMPEKDCSNTSAQGRDKGEETRCKGAR